MPHAFAYRRARGVPFRIHVRGLPRFGHGQTEQRYRLVEDDEVAAELKTASERRGTPLFRSLSGDALEEALDSADEATDAIAAGEYDEALDLLLFAERESFNCRVTVIDAITDRHRKLVEQHKADSEPDQQVVSPEEVAPDPLVSG